MIKETPSDYQWNKSTRALVHNLASFVKGTDLPKSELIVNGIINGDLKTSLQVDAAFKYVKANGEASTKMGMNENSGVGIEITEDQVRNYVMQYIQENKERILTERYKLVPGIFADVKNLKELKWADPRSFKPIIDQEVLKLLGPKDERDLIKKKTKNNEKKKTNSAKKSSDNSASSGPKRTMFNEGFLGDLHKVGENPQAYPELMKEHLEVTGGKVRTRFLRSPMDICILVILKLLWLILAMLNITMVPVI